MRTGPRATRKREMPWPNSTRSARAAQRRPCDTCTWSARATPQPPWTTEISRASARPIPPMRTSMRSACASTMPPWTMLTLVASTRSAPPWVIETLSARTTWSAWSATAMTGTRTGPRLAARGSALGPVAFGLLRRRGFAATAAASSVSAHPARRARLPPALRRPPPRRPGPAFARPGLRPAHDDLAGRPRGPYDHAEVEPDGEPEPDPVAEPHAGAYPGRRHAQRRLDPGRGGRASPAPPDRGHGGRPGGRAAAVGPFRRGPHLPGTGRGRHPTLHARLPGRGPAGGGAGPQQPALLHRLGRGVARRLRPRGRCAQRAARPARAERRPRLGRRRGPLGRRPRLPVAHPRALLTAQRLVVRGEAAGAGRPRGGRPALHDPRLDVQGVRRHGRAATRRLDRRALPREPHHLLVRPGVEPLPAGHQLGEAAEGRGDGPRHRARQRRGVVHGRGPAAR